MEVNDRNYIELAMRTQNHALNKTQIREHAIWGLCSEVMELHQCILDNESREEILGELGDCFWMMAELCDIDRYRFETFGGVRVKCDPLPRVLADMRNHLGGLCGVYQKHLQGHKIDKKRVQCLIGGLSVAFGMIAGLYGASVEDVMQMNIAKLMKRYPDGFEVERSLHREE